MPQRKPAILIVEDTAALRMIYGTALTEAGYAVETAASAAEGLAKLRALRPDLVLLDLMLKDRESLTVMREMQAERPNLPVIAMTSDRTVPHAVEAIQTGAQNVLVKPFDEARLVEAVAAARRQLPPRNGRPGLFIGTSEVMRRTHDRLRAAAQSHAPVFLIGENGTGKALCAQTLHDLSSRARHPFVTLHCTGISPEQMEREFSGDTRSAHGGGEGQTGAAVLASGGTLYLDDICELSLDLQAKLLAFLNTATVHPQGDATSYQVDTRIVCGTSCDPMTELRAGRLRADLYYRLHVVPLRIPPLRERGEDILALARHVLRWIAREENRPFDQISDDAAQILRAHPWPGNVRQLINTIRLAVVMHEGPVLRAYMIAPLEREHGGVPIGTALIGSTPDGSAPNGFAMNGEHWPPEGPLGFAAPFPEEGARPDTWRPDTWQLDALAGRTLAQIERAVIESALRRNDASVPRAARELDVAPSTLYRKMAGWDAKP